MPIQTWDADGALIFDTDKMTRGLCIGSLTIPANQAITKTYPALAGCGLRLYRGLSASSVRASDTDISLTYPGSVPTITANISTQDRTLLVWATGSVTSIPNSGLYAESASGTVALTPDAHGFNYLGKATFSSFSPSYGIPTDDGWLGSAELYFDHANDIVPIVRLSEGEYVELKSYRRASALRWSITATRLAMASNGWAWPELRVPEVYVFGRPIHTGSERCATYDDAGTLVWDLCRSRLLYPVDAPLLSDEEDAVTLPVSGAVGVMGKHQHGSG